MWLDLRQAVSSSRRHIWAQKLHPRARTTTQKQHSLIQKFQDLILLYALSNSETDKTTAIFIFAIIFFLVFNLFEYI